MLNGVGAVLISEADIKLRVEELGRQIARDYAGRDLLLVGVLKGAAVFMVDLARAIELPLAIDFMAVSSYGGASESSGVMRILKDLDADVEGRNLLLVEDIVDSGSTLAYLFETLKLREPREVRVCALLKKVKTRQATVDIDYTGFEIPDKFVVGYGLDYGERYRNLPHVALLAPEACEAGP